MSRSDPFVDKQLQIPDETKRVSYRLKLPRDVKVHPVFHVRYLEPPHPNTPMQETFYFEPDNEN